MKAKLFFMLCLSVSSLVACGDNVIVVQQKELPQSAQQFINQYFADFSISYITKEHNEFEVNFTNGFNVEFDKNGNWTDVDCKQSPVPSGIVPERITAYIKTNFPNNFIKEISKKFPGYYYDVELNNGLDLVFDKQGNFRHFDD